MDTNSTSIATMVEMEMDMEVKSEYEDDNISCCVSVTSSVEEVLRLQSSKSDEEEFEDEPLIEIESVTVPQELVKDESEPNVLLFVKKDPAKRNSLNNTIGSRSYFGKCVLSKDDKYTQTDTSKGISITKALRSVKTKPKSNLNNNSGQIVKKIKNRMRVPKPKTLGLKSSTNNAKAKTSSPPDFLSCYVKSDSGKKPKRNLKILRKKEGRKIKSNNEKNVKKFKSRIPEELSQQNSPLDIQISENSFPKEINIIKDSYLRGASEELHKSGRKSKGKENTQCNNEKENSADSVYSSGNHELNTKEENESIKDFGKTPKPKPKSYDCTICGKQFREKSHLATHARAHNDVRNFKCNECGLLFKTKTNLYYHMKTHEAPFLCSKCNKTFSQKKMFTRHMRVVHSGEGLYSCGICGRPFKSAQNLELHYTLHTGNKPFTCDVCPKSFVYKTTYRAHMRAHKADEMFDCEVCLAAGAQDKGELRRRCQHYSQARPWLCTVCGKGYPLKATLKSHMKSHEPEKPFKCEECGKCFMKRQTYECHIKTHTGEKPQYMCDQCSQSYYSGVSLKRHYLKHTSERKFICDTCNKAFWTKDAMKVHKRSHENMKSFHCSQCPKAFAHKHSLVAHLRTHTGEHLHSCDVCCKTFLHKYHLTRHLRQHSSLFPPPPPPALPLNPSLYMLPPHTHMDMPTLQIL